MTQGYFLIIRNVTLSFSVGLCSMHLSVQAASQSQRDPTIPPVEAGLSNNALTAKALKLEPGVSAIIVRNGTPYLVVGTRLYAQGELFGQARIERITETAVWYRETGVLRKVSQFSGIERYAPVSKCDISSPQKLKAAKSVKVSKSVSASETSSPVATCSGDQPKARSE